MPPDIEPMITYGTNPGHGHWYQRTYPVIEEVDEKEKPSFQKSLALYGPGSRHRLLKEKKSIMYLSAAAPIAVSKICAWSPPL